MELDPTDRQPFQRANLFIVDYAGDILIRSKAVVLVEIANFVVVKLSMGLDTLPTVLMGVATVYVFYRLAKNFMPEKYALVASTFLSFDLIFFIHSSIFLLDTPAILFGLLGIMLYFEKRYLLMANSFGLACLMKETGGFFVLIILIVHVTLNYRQRLTKIKTLATSVLWAFQL